MLIVAGVGRECDAIRSELCRCPLRCRLLRVGDIRGGGRVQNVDALMYRVAPIMDVSVDVGFDPLPRSDDFPEFLRVDQTAGKVQWITAETWIVVRDNNCRLGRQTVEGRGKPSELQIANRSLSHHRLLQRVEQKEVGVLCLDDGNVS